MSTRREILKGMSLAGIATLANPGQVIASTNQQLSKAEYKTRIDEIMSPMFSDERVAAIVSTSTNIYGENSLGVNQYYEQVKDPACIVIKQNGFEESHPLFTNYPALRENLTLYVNEAQGMVELTADQFRDIVVGRIKNWKQISGIDQPISIYRLRLKHKNREALDYRIGLALQGVGLNGADSKSFIQVDSYEELASMGIKDKGALVLGLRSLYPQDLHPVAIDGVWWNIIEKPTWPLSYDVNISVRLSQDGLEESKTFMLQYYNNYTQDIFAHVKLLSRRG